MRNEAEIQTLPMQSMSAGDSTATLSLIERAVNNPDVDIDKMERLLAMHERVLERQARAAYAEALSMMQDDLPAIAERGNVAGRYTYALWEDINAKIKPVLRQHGFALSFRTDTSGGAVSVTGVLSHKQGHSEQTTMQFPADGSGNKNPVQAISSSVSYGKRYTAGALLNLTSYGEDDDAFAAAGEPDADPAWYDAIENADDMDTLKQIANELRTAGLTGRALRNVRSAWSKRSKEIAK